MKTIIGKILLKNPIRVDSPQLALSYLMDNKVECASYIAMSPYERKHRFTSFLRRHYL